MATAREFRIAPQTTRRRGLPPIGLSVFAPDNLDVTIVETGSSALLFAAEADRHGRRIGEIEIELFAASMVIDPDGALVRAAETALDRLLTAPAAGVVRHRARFELDDGTSGLRLEALMTRDRAGAPAALPHVTLLALAPDDAAARGGLIAVVRSALPTWAAADTLFETLRVLTRDLGVNDNDSPRLPRLPFTRA